MNKFLATATCATLFIGTLPARTRAQDSIPQTQQNPRHQPVHHTGQTPRRNPPDLPNPAALDASPASAAQRPDYWSINLTAGQFSLANVHHTDQNSSSLSIPRLTAVLNVAALYNYDLSDGFGFYTGAVITNLGTIIKNDGIKYKRRIYTLGIPLAFKLGSLKYANFYAGLQVDWALQYQEKHKVGDTVISKFGEWWSDRTPRILGSWFIGGQLLHTLDFRIQSYFTNFFNRNYTGPGGAKPYANIIARPLLLTFGFNFITGKKYTFRTLHTP